MKETRENASIQFHPEIEKGREKVQEEYERYISSCSKQNETSLAL